MEDEFYPDRYEDEESEYDLDEDEDDKAESGFYAGYNKALNNRD